MTTIGLYTIVSLEDMAIAVYAYATYELALAQAKENEQGVEGPVERLPETRLDNGMRQTVWRYVAQFEIAMVQEIKVSTQVHPVN